MVSLPAAALAPPTERSPDGLALLHALFGRAGAGEIEVRTRHRRDGRRSAWPSSWFGTPQAAHDFITEQSGRGLEVFVGVGRRLDRGEKGAGDNDSVAELTAAWVDLDPPEGADPAAFQRGALGRLLGHGPPPSCVVSSGRGLHAYWFLRAPADPEFVRRVNLALAEDLGGDTNACDPARCLRALGSPNLKTDPPTHTAPLHGDLSAPRRYDVAGLPSVDRPRADHAPRPAMPELIACVLEHGDRARRGSGGRVVLRCPFHDDNDPSAVVFPQGWLHCSGCGVNEPARVWAARPEVRSWDAARHVPSQSRTRARSRLPRAARVALLDVGPLLLGHPEHAPAAASRLQACLVDPATGVIEADNPAAVVERLSTVVGTIGYRVLFALMLLSQQPGRPKGVVGFHANLATLGALLGYQAGRDGRLSSKVRGRLQRALDGLRHLVVTVQWSPRTEPVEGPILSPGAAADGSDGDVLHDGLARQARGRSAAWAAFHPATLHLRTDEAALVLTGQWRRQDRQRDELRIDLAELAARAGIRWNARRAAHDRARYIQRWASPLNAVADVTGVRVEADSGQVVVRPAAGEGG